MVGWVTDIVRGSFHDGPGIRTVVFLQGCPLRCAWCHNPETWSTRPVPLFYPDRCLGCGACGGSEQHAGRSIADVLALHVSPASQPLPLPPTAMLPITIDAVAFRQLLRCLAQRDGPRIVHGRIHEPPSQRR